jgi:O-antigen/teichoic acid export membrane protein
LDRPGVTSTPTGIACRQRRRRLARQADDGNGTDELPSPARDRPLSLRVNFSWSLMGNLVYIATRYGMVVVLTQLGGAEMMARGMKGFFICAPFAALGNLGLRAVLVTDARREYRFADYLGLRMITATVALLLTAGTVLLLGYRAEAFLIVLVVAIGKLFESLSDIFHGLQQHHERMDRVSIAVMIRGTLALLLLAVGVYLTGNLVVGMIGFPLAMAAVFLLWDLPQGLRTWSASMGDGIKSGGHAIRRFTSVKPRWNVKTLGSLGWLALPLAIVATEVALFQNLPRYMVEYFLGVVPLGVFHAIGSIVTAGFLLVMSMGASASPRLAKCFAEGNAAAFYRLLFKLLGLVGCLGAGGVIVMWLFASPLLEFVYRDPDITKAADLAVWMMIFAAVMYLNGPLGRALDATRQFRIHLAIRTTGILLALVLLPILIERHGLTGAAMAMVASAACLTGLYVAAIVRTVKQISPPEGQLN